MARIKLVEQNEATGAEKERYDELAGRNAVTNMKKGLLNDAATYDAYMAWYTSWNRLVEVIGEKDAILYAHKISTTNSCQLCSLFFISDVKGLGLDPANLVYDEKETLLARLAEQIVKDPTAVSDELIDNLASASPDRRIQARYLERSNQVIKPIPSAGGKGIRALPFGISGIWKVTGC